VDLHEHLGLEIGSASFDAWALNIWQATSWVLYGYFLHLPHLPALIVAELHLDRFLAIICFARCTDTQNRRKR
jgi:hypothetical protein